MAGELMSAQTSLKYCIETTAGTRPTTGYTALPNIVDIPELGGKVQTAESTDLSDTNVRYVQTLIDNGATFDVQVNLTLAFKTAWATLCSAAQTGATSSKRCWFEISYPTLGSIFFEGQPVELGSGGAKVNNILQATVQIVLGEYEGWGTSST